MSDEIEAVDQLEATDVAYYAGSQRACNEDGCTLGRTEAEQAYETLMSGLPDSTGGGVYEVPSAQGRSEYVTPTEETYNMVMNTIRPSDEHAIQPIADTWRLMADDSLTNIDADLNTAIKNLANSWKGDDFDALEENMTKTLSNLGRTKEKVLELATELDDAAENLRIHQKVSETPFPPAGFNLVNDEDGCCDDYKLHVRPPWHSGDCIIKEGGDQIAEVLCAEGSTFAAEERDKIESDAAAIQEAGGYY
ncbi:WXG100 family type VII secretion target [Glycomyces paridis]|uniref:WXG100 family type VII secretion target n=1 Tax=Glycomyces paridis TaxID=2126555 RepID=A0A4V6T6E2_9ACTN|nr:hypothetical protein [Glycomyces paridis]THV30106.1 hypothetical protein E9998_06930 [Glycomyces paridis]